MQDSDEAVENLSKSVICSQNLFKQDNKVKSLFLKNGVEKIFLGGEGAKSITFSSVSTEENFLHDDFIGFSQVERWYISLQNRIYVLNSVG